MTGGKGNDLFVHSNGNDIINDYEKKDKISVGSAYTDFEVIEKDLVFYFGEENTLTITDGANKPINLDSTVNYYVDGGLINAKQKLATLSADADIFDATQFSKLATIDASAVTDEVAIIGNKKSNAIIAGNHDATLSGGKGKDTLFGGEGEDLFIYENKSGKDIIENYAEGEVISLASGVVIKDITTKRNDTIIKTKCGSITVSETADKKITLAQNGSETIFSGGLAVDEDEDLIKAVASFRVTIDLSEYEVSTADASEAKKSVTISGSDDDNYLIGGAGADSLWGGKGNDTLYGSDGDDSFIFRAGGGKVFVSGVTASTSVNINNDSKTVSELIS